MSSFHKLEPISSIAIVIMPSISLSSPRFCWSFCYKTLLCTNHDDRFIFGRGIFSKSVLKKPRVFCTAPQIAPNCATIILQKFFGLVMHVIPKSKVTLEHSFIVVLICFRASNCTHKIYFFLVPSSLVFTMFQYPVIQMSRLAKSSRTTGCWFE